MADDDRKFTEVTPFAGLVYDLNDEWSLYASYTDIFNPQNYRDRNGNYLDPVIGKSYEIGAKAELFDGGLNAQVAIFDMEQDNVAVRDGTLLVPGGDNEYAYRGQKGITSKGIEVELSGEVRPGWNLFVGASALRLRDADGERIDTANPTQTIKIATTYNLPGQWEQWTVGGGLRWQNQTWTDVGIGNNTYRVRQGSYAVVDVMARYDINDQWSAQLNVNNLFDKSYYNTPYEQITYGQPRNAMLTLVSRF
ncbi:TonB-dependent receptor [Paracoccus sp. DMF-8]|nr:TonB-dependent receptor [Paracoccus sp. DMF-8]MDF3605795.1 TonB-dependent receptor [Paracoccus sp. DMF-8]